MFERMYYTVIRTPHDYYRDHPDPTVNAHGAETITGVLYEDEAKAWGIVEMLVRSQLAAPDQFPATYRVAIVKVSELPDETDGANDDFDYLDTDPLF